MQLRARSEGAHWLVCTQKDAVKLTPAHAQVLELPLYVAEQSIVNGEALLEWVQAALSRHPGGVLE